MLSTRWVAVAKKDGETKDDIARASVVARDYASGGPTAAELGISKPHLLERIIPIIPCVCVRDWMAHRAC